MADFGVTVGTSSTLILASNGSRVKAYFQNDSPTQTVYLMIGGAAASLNNGVRLSPNGDKWETGYNSTGAVYGIATAASAKITGTEV